MFRIKCTDLRKQADVIISVPYGFFQTNTNTFETFYNLGVYGWNFSGFFYRYMGKNYAIISGYRPVIKSNISYVRVKDLSEKYQNALNDKQNGKYKLETLDSIARKVVEMLITAYEIEHGNIITFVNESEVK